MKVVAIIQARMGSSRLPGKVMMDLAGEPMLARVVRRITQATSLNQVIVATTTAPADTVIANLCAEYGWSCFRGSELDLLDRYYQAAKAHEADIVVRITSDNPLIDPAIVDLVVHILLDQHLDYASNSLAPHTYPLGLDAEVMTLAALERAWREDRNPAWREHVTPYIYAHPELFQIRPVNCAVNYSAMRWTVDTWPDFLFVRTVYDHFGHDRFTWQDVLAGLEQFPEWLAINQNIQQKTLQLN